MKKNKKLNIAIIGLGNIGTYLYKYLSTNQKILFKKNNCLPNITFVSAKNKNKKRGIKISKKKWLNNFLDATKSKNVDVIVELIGGAEGAAKKLVFNALKNKKHVVTANKALIAKYGDQLSKIAEQNKVNLEFEAAVCGGVPIIRSLKESFIANKINKVYGIFNGTSNYILSSMDKENRNFKDVLLNAQKLGFAESNPISDLNGDDVAAKLKILSSLCFNSFIDDKIHVEGIKNIDKVDIDNANKLGYKIKLLGVSEIIENKVYQRVHPSLIKKSSYIASIDGVLNAVIVNGTPIGESIIQGEGAGPKATTSALISDISSILRGNIKFPFSISNNERKKINYEGIDERFFSAYLRFEVLDKPGVLSNITTIFSKNKVSIKRLIQNPYKSKKFSSIIIITHSSKDKFLNKILKQVEKKSYIIEKPKLIRIGLN
ncbi:homoserine dehydrogenase [Pelagibacteraceae bacterium]|nr:homoserine dehydrogenase [Pelagibacteraceae bacterium]MDC0339617.1 homoserine dehydrogenase [Pelagibacteraceae bacterium]MDC0366259.1 homoserine dehydrogenase [Pelagibacteraceae bacterium]